MNFKENTLKYHNRNIYSKLGISNRKQLKALAATLNSQSV
jgi:DNA-binding CsgD family transcriptional regulator